LCIVESVLDYDEEGSGGAVGLRNEDSSF